MKVDVKFCSHCGRVRAFREDDERVQSKRCQDCLQGEFQPIVLTNNQTIQFATFES